MSFAFLYRLPWTKLLSIYVCSHNSSFTKAMLTKGAGLSAAWWLPGVGTVKKPKWWELDYAELRFVHEIRPEYRVWVFWCSWQNVQLLIIHSGSLLSLTFQSMDIRGNSKYHFPCRMKQWVYQPYISPPDMLINWRASLRVGNAYVGLQTCVQPLS